MPEENEELTQEELAELQKVMALTPKQEEKSGIFSFFKEIISKKDSTKVANLDPEIELFPVRTYLDTAQYCDIMGLDKVAEYLRGSAEIILATSLSKKGFLIKHAITTKKEFKAGDIAKRPKRIFSKRKEEGEE